MTCPFGTMDWYCCLAAGHAGPHESHELPPDPPKLESRADLHRAATQPEKEGLAAGSGKPVCTHCGTGQHTHPLWRNSRAVLDEYRTTDTVCNEFSGDVWLHANCIAEFMREHPALALSIPT